MIRRALALVVALVALTACSSPSNRLSPADFQKFYGQPGVVLVDVRTPAEFAAGHIAGAKNIDFEASTFEAEFGKLPKDVTYAIYCRSGNRSGQALTKLSAAGFSKVSDLSGGIVAWTGAGLPLAK